MKCLSDYADLRSCFDALPSRSWGGRGQQPVQLTCSHIFTACAFLRNFTLFLHYTPTCALGSPDHHHPPIIHPPPLPSSTHHPPYHPPTTSTHHPSHHPSHHPPHHPPTTPRILCPPPYPCSPPPAAPGTRGASRTG